MFFKKEKETLQVFYTVVLSLYIPTSDIAPNTLSSLILAILVSTYILTFALKTFAQILNYRA